jgi:hypothetical protein
MHACIADRWVTECPAGQMHRHTLHYIDPLVKLPEAQQLVDHAT